MASKRKGKVPSTAHNPNVLAVELPDGESRERALARIVMSPHVQAAFTIESFESPDYELTSLAEELSTQVDAVHTGDMKRAEAMLITQAHTLNELFNHLSRRAAQNIGKYLNATETFMRLALKAQSQCRATLETLSTVKNPPVIYARQANVTTGPQQVNNGIPAPRTRENEIKQSKLLEEKDGQRLDTGAAGTTSGLDSDMVPMEAIDGAEDGRR